MSHLTLETLARLIDEAPDPTEAGHLDICQKCRDELEALRADAAALHALPDPEPSIAQWLRLEQRLEREGLMRRRGWSWQPALLRAAAALVIFVLGAAAATLVLRPSERSLITANDLPPGRTVTAPETVYVPASAIAESVVQEPARSAAPAPVAALQTAGTPEEAVARLRSAEGDYLAALTRYTELSGRVEDGDPLARLAALESIVATTRAALGRAPADPVINGYHLTAVAQRDALLRQVSASGSTWY